MLNMKYSALLLIIMSLYSQTAMAYNYSRWIHVINQTA